MKAAVALFLLAAWSAASPSPPSPEPRYFRSQRPIENLPSTGGQACVAIDPGIFSHAQPGLADLRLYRGDPTSANSETPYVVRNATPVVAAEGLIELLNKGLRGGQTGFDVEMPDGHYSDLELAINSHNFIATVTVAGSQTQSSPETKLGEYTIFDLSKQRLGRSTVLHLPESDFKYLHFKIAGPIKPDFVTGISAERLPESVPRYVTVAQIAQGVRKGHDSVFEFTVPAHTPVDRLTFTVDAQPAQFSRDVSIQVVAVPTAPQTDAPRYPQLAAGSGNLLRVHSVENGHRIDEERLTVDAPQADYDTPAKWTVTIDNGDDAPLSITSVRLEMVERDLCFESAAGTAYMLYYGDAALVAPRYDYASLFVPQKDAAKATAGPEQPNAAYEPRPDQRPFTERHPALLWAVLIVVIAVLGVVALGSVKKAG
jgi:Protein of unknown function (DUF3999)